MHRLLLAHRSSPPGDKERSVESPATSVCGILLRTSLKPAKFRSNPQKISKKSRIPLLRGELVPPGVGGALEAPASGVLPLRLGGKFLAGPAGVRLGVLVGDVNDRMALPSAQVAARSLRVAPAGLRDVGPPVANVSEVDGARCLPEDERARNEQGGIGFREVRGVEGALGERYVTAILNEAPELGVGYGVLVHPEAVDGDPVDRTLLWIEVVGAHQESTARHPDHVLVRRPASRVGRYGFVRGEGRLMLSAPSVM